MRKFLKEAYEDLIYILGIKKYKISIGEEYDALFLDDCSYNCYKDDLIYYVTISEGGVYKVKSESANTIHKNWGVWETLIEIGLIKGIYKNIENAQECCLNSNKKSTKEIDKAFLKELNL